MKKLLTVGSVLVLAFGVFIGVTHADSVGPITFGAPYSLGSVNDQDGWSATGPYDQAVVNTSDFGSPSGIGSTALRVSDAITSGSFGDWIFAKPLTDSVGETSSTAGSFSVGTKQNHFEMQFDIAAASTTPQTGLEVSVAPDRGDGSRMSYLRFEDSASGINVFFDDVQGTSNPANFVETQIATGLNRAVSHHVKLTLDTLDGPSNDVVKVYIDNSLVHTGTSWENYYRYDSEASAEQSPRIVKTMIIQARGTAHPADSGYGFLFGNVSLSSSEVTPDTTPPVVTVTPVAGSLLHGTTTFAIGVTDNNPLDPTKNTHVWVYLYNASGTQKSQGASVNLSNGSGTFTVDTTKLDNGDAWLDVGQVFDAAGNPSGRTDNYFKDYDVENSTVPPSVPTLVSPANGVTTPTNVFTFTWSSSTASVPGPVTYEFHSTMNPAETDGVLTTGLWDSGTLTNPSILSTGAPDGTWYWQVRAKDAVGNMSAWSDIWAVTLNTVPPPPLATCPEGTTPTLVETDMVNSNLATSTIGANTLANGQTYLLVASGTWQNASINVADSAYASVDNWSTYMQGYNLAPYHLGSGEFQLQVNGSFINWGAYQPTHQYADLYTGTGNPLSLMVFDGDSTASPATPNASWYGDNSGSVSVNVYACDSNVPPAVTYVTTGSSTDVTFTSATVNGTNGQFNADDTSFWWGTTSAGPFTAGGNVAEFPATDWSHDTGLGSAVIGGSFNEALTGLTPGTTYYYVAWSKVGGVWYPGSVLSFTTPQPSYVTTEPATDVTAADATMNGLNGSADATGHSFWVSTSTFSTASPNIPDGVYSTPDFGAISASTTFSAPLSLVTTAGIPGNLPAVMPNTTYYYAAWSLVNGTWYPGAIETVTTSALSGDATLSALSVSAGTLSPDFSPSTTAYTDVLPHNMLLIPTVTATTTDPDATMSITQATSTSGTATVAVTAPNGSSTQNYTVAFSLAPATTSILNVIVQVDNSAGGHADPSDFLVSLFAVHASKYFFPGDAEGTSVTIAPNTHYNVNVSHLPFYNEGISGNCNDPSGLSAGGSATCTITETYHAPGPIVGVGAGIDGNYGHDNGNHDNGNHGGQVLGASVGGNDALQAQIDALQAQLLALLQQYLGILHGHH